MDNAWTMLELPDKVDYDYVMHQFLKLKGKVIINISSTPNERAVLFTADNLQALLLTGLRKLYVEIMEEKQYRSLMLQQLTNLLASAEKIESHLYNEYVTDLFVPITDFLSRLQNITVMLTCLALQKDYNHLSKNLDELHQFQEELGNCALFLEDNVCCLDDLHYKIMPCLKQIINQMKNKTF